MAQTISRLYDSRAKADEAVAALKKRGFSNDSITVVAPPDGPGTAADPADIPNDGIPAAIMAGEVPRAHAIEFAGLVRKGATLVTVRPPLGSAKLATSILDGFGPTETALADPIYEPPPVDVATPLSSALGWKVLLNNPAPLSSWLGWRTLSPRQAPTKTASRTVDSPAPFSRSIGMHVLSDNPAPLSARLGWRVLSEKQSPPPKRLGMELLDNNPAPLSTRFGWKLLSNNPAPLSSWLGWRVLSDNPAPLSSWFGWRVLSDKPKPPAKP